jgi:hypothetical protein
MTRSGLWLVLVACTLPAGCGVGGLNSSAPPGAGGSPFAGAGGSPDGEPCTAPGCGGSAPAVEAVPRAVCGPGARPENGLQGQIPQEDRVSGRSREGYWCNLEKVGQWRQGEGASWQFAWYDDCGYYGTLRTDARRTPPGVVVVKASDPAHPVQTAVLDTPAMVDPHESLKVNEKRALLGAVDLYSGAGAGNEGSGYFDVYDVSGDCSQPRLVTSTNLAGTLGHEGEWTPDGLTYWGSSISDYFAIDVENPANPRVMLHWTPYAANSGTQGSGACPGGPPSCLATHGLSVTEDGSRGYFTSLSPAGMVIADVADVHARKPGAGVREISRINWSDGIFAQHTIPVTIQGKPYVIHVDEGAHGAARIIDVSNELVPLIVSKLKLEAHLPQNCEATQPEGACTAYGPVQWIYDGHYCTVDRRQEATTLACAYFESGIRVFDIRDPAAPKEIAYYNPGAIAGDLPGSSHNSGATVETADHCTAQVRLIPERGELWTQCQRNEFLVLRFTNGVWPFE